MWSEGGSVEGGSVEGGSVEGGSVEGGETTAAMSREWARMSTRGKDEMKCGGGECESTGSELQL